MFILNKNIVHLVDDIFWNWGFRLKRRSRVFRFLLCLFQLFQLSILSIDYFNYLYYIYYCNHCDYFWVRVDLRVADHVWADKRAEIAKKVDDLGDQFRPAMRAGWLAYMTWTYERELSALILRYERELSALILRPIWYPQGPGFESGLFHEACYMPPSVE